MRKLIVIFALATLAFAPNALASGQAQSSLVGCPDDPKQVIQNASLSVQQGRTGTASFTINPACSSVQVSLVSYSHSAPFFTWENAADEIVVDAKTQTLGPGNYSFSVRVPDCYYQVDLVRGDVIQKLGPANSNNFYSRQNRLVAAENGGTKACAPIVNIPPPPPTPPTPPIAPPPPVDVCLNIEGIQTTPPLNFDRDVAGNCTLPPVDVCLNIEGIQTKTPDGMVQKNSTCATVQVKGKKKVSKPKPDVCKNIKGSQVKVPKGKVQKNGNCVTVQVKGQKKVSKPKSLPYTP